MALDRKPPPHRVGWFQCVRYVHNLSGWEEHRIEAAEPLTPGRHTLVFRFDRTADHQGRGTLLVDGAPVASGDIPHFT